MASLRSCPYLLLTLALACGSADDDDESSVTGNVGEQCISGTVCQVGLECIDGVCMTASGDGDTSSGDGDGDSSGDGDGDGDPSSGDGDGDTGGAPKGLYEGPCLSAEDCEDGLWCAYANSRYWCTTSCAGANDTSCPAHPGASAMPACNSVTDNDPQSGNNLGCTLVCNEESECPPGAQCFGSGLGSEAWCGFL